MYNEHEIMHYGVPGMKWGVRRYQNEDGSLTNRGQARYNRVEKKYNKEIDKSRAYANDLLAARTKNRQKIVDKYDRKINKYINKKGGETDYSDYLKEKRDFKVKDFDNGTKFIKTGLKKHENVINNYKTYKLNNISGKETKNAKDIVRAYNNQKYNDVNYGPTWSVLNYATEAANTPRK